MTEPAAELIGFTARGDRVEASFVLLIDEHIERVWTALTAPDWLPQWLAPGTIELWLGGAVGLDFSDSGGAIDSTVNALTLGAMLEYSWSQPGEPERPMRWQLEPLGPTTRLMLTLNLPATENVARSCAGWAAHRRRPGRHPNQVSHRRLPGLTRRVCGDARRGSRRLGLADVVAVRASVTRDRR